MAYKNKLLALAGFLVVMVAGPASAQRRDIGASNKGVVNPSEGCNAAFDNPCVIFTPASGATPAQFTSHSPFDNPEQGGPFDLFAVPTNQPVTFQFSDPNLQFGSFFCGSIPGLPAGSCTDLGATINDQLTSDVDILNAQLLISTFFSSGYPGAIASTLTLTFNAANPDLPANWVFYATSGEASLSTTVAAVPEPTSLLLLGSGLMAAGFFRRRHLRK